MEIRKSPVTVNKPLNEEFIQGLVGAGVPILGMVTRKCRVEQESAQVFGITLMQGLDRPIRRMCKYFGFQVTRLERVRIMNSKLASLPLGEWQDLTGDERATLF